MISGAISLNFTLRPLFFFVRAGGLCVDRGLLVSLDCELDCDCMISCADGHLRVAALVSNFPSFGRACPGAVELLLGAVPVYVSLSVGPCKKASTSSADDGFLSLSFPNKRPTRRAALACCGLSAMYLSMLILMRVVYVILCAYLQSEVSTILVIRPTKTNEANADVVMPLPSPPDAVPKRTCLSACDATAAVRMNAVPCALSDRLLTLVFAGRRVLLNVMP